MWRARATAAGVPEYRSVFTKLVLPSLKALDGFVSADVLEEADDVPSADAREIVVITRWRSMDAVRGFAGAEVSRAVVEPEALACLVWADDRVHHYEIGVSATT